jgi:hypothetical protein
MGGMEAGSESYRLGGMCSVTGVSPQLEREVGQNLRRNISQELLSE